MPGITDLFRKQETTPGGRQKNTDLINSLVMRDENGHYNIDTESAFVQDFVLHQLVDRYIPYVRKPTCTARYTSDELHLICQEELTTFEKRSRKDTAHGLPMNIMKAQCGGEAGFREAQERKDIYKGEENGRERWFWHESEEIKESGWEDKSKTRVGQKQISRQEAGLTYNLLLLYLSFTVIIAVDFLYG